MFAPTPSPGILISVNQKPPHLVLRLLLFLPAALLPCCAPAQGSGYLLVVTKQDRALTVVDGTSLQVVAHVPIGQDPHEVVGPDHRTAFVSNYADGTLHTIARVDLLTQKPLPPIDVSPLRGVHGLFLQGETLWFTAEGSKSHLTSTNSGRATPTAPFRSST